MKTKRTIRIPNICLPIDHGDEDLRRAVANGLAIDCADLVSLSIHRRSVDARKKGRIQFVYTIDAEILTEKAPLNRSPSPDFHYELPCRAPERLESRPIVIGAGPCGLFAALLLAQMGFRPIVLERGKSAVERAKDVKRFWNEGVLNPQSNVAFGEGGAGTFSDGKLTTQIKDREHRCRKVLEELAKAGAPPEILYLAKPHIGTDILIKVVGELRGEIEKLGGEVRFETQATELFVENGETRGIVLSDGTQIETDCVVLAIGHSARDTFEMLRDGGIALEPKPFSIGARIEHPQGMIDRCQYGSSAGNPILGPADYKLVHHCANGRSAYTFCMCPGGDVIGASTEPGGIVTNGMSVHSRNRPNANSALLVGVEPRDFIPEDAVSTEASPLAGVEFQRRWERLAFKTGGDGFKAPIQLVGGFLSANPSQSIGEVTPSYQPGYALCDLRECLPSYAIDAMREAIHSFDKKLRGFAMPDAVLTGVETRSSSPVRILRGADGQSVSLRGLFPAGEGAGYAGGIVSSAVDGIKAAEAVARRLSRI